MKRSLLLLLMASVLAVLPATTVASAGQPTELTLELPPEAGVGDSVAIDAYLRDQEGNPIPDQPVVFYTETAFLNTYDNTVIGRVTTDENGRARLQYTLRSSGETKLTARFEGNAQWSGAKAKGSFTVSPGPQLYQEEVPFRVPGVNVALMAIILGTVWSIYLGVMILLLMVSRAGTRESPRGAA